MARIRKFDIALTFVVTAILLISTHRIGGFDGVGYALLGTAGLSMLFRRLFPRAAFAVIGTVLIVYVSRGYSPGPIFAAGWIGLFTLRIHTDRRTAFAAAVALCAGLIAGSLLIAHHANFVPLAFVGWSFAALFLGEAVSNRKDFIRERVFSVEKEMQGRIAEDRLQIARDLHDSVAHAMATISVQAGAGVHVIDRNPADAKQALLTIQRASADVLDELASMLSLLRDDSEDGPLRPTPGITEIAQLVSQTDENSAIDVTLETEGVFGGVSSAISIAAYRIVQESLTNVIRHSGATSATVALRNNGELVVEIRDNGNGSATDSTGSGVGIRGMRERAESTGGAFEAGPDPAGGYVVRSAWRRAA
jgi:signal transduction histidine kinase